MSIDKTVTLLENDEMARKPSRAEAEEAVKVLIRWAGDDPSREGLVETPSRVVRAYEEFFTGYSICPKSFLKRTFEETAGYDEIVLLRASYGSDYRKNSCRLLASSAGARNQ